MLDTEKVFKLPPGPYSQREVAAMMGVSRTCIYLIEQRALRKIRRALEREAGAEGFNLEAWLGRPNR